jgi:hypothetical protein
MGRWYLPIAGLVALIIPSSGCFRYGFQAGGDGGGGQGDAVQDLESIDAPADSAAPGDLPDPGISDTPISDAVQTTPVDGNLPLDVPWAAADSTAKPDHGNVSAPDSKHPPLTDLIVVDPHDSAPKKDTGVIAPFDVSISVESPWQPTACASGPPTFSYAADMVICSDPTGVDQCSAQSLCNMAAGWHLCTATEFRARGGKKTPAQSPAWIAGCIRAGGAPHAPVDAVCLCTAAAAPLAAVHYSCDTSLFGESPEAHVGLVSYGLCFSVGTLSPTTEAYWVSSPSHSARGAAVCCSP